ncbi:hypothetical protein ACWDPI_33490, partial [Streptomyces zhihengii]
PCVLTAVTGYGIDDPDGKGLMAASVLTSYGTGLAAIEAACRIIILEDQLEEAQRINAEYRRAAEKAGPEASS